MHFIICILLYAFYYKHWRWYIGGKKTDAHFALLNTLYTVYLLSDTVVLEIRMLLDNIQQFQIQSWVFKTDKHIWSDR